MKYTNTTSQLMYVAQEHSIYGSSRVGVDNRKDTLYMGAAYTNTWGGVGASRRELGLKSFELANHLGNVLVTVSDKPIYKVSSGVVYFNPEVSSISDYYPFGAPINGRGYATETYRFGYNTQEKTDEIAGPGNHNTATFWEYDGRLGRRWNIDPVDKPWESLYATNNSNPIVFTDPFGLFGSLKEAREYRREHRKDLKLQGAKIKKGNDGIYSIEDKNGGWSYSRDDLKAARPDIIGVQEDGVLRTMLISADKSNKPTSVGHSNGGVNWNGVNTGLQVADGIGVAAAAGREIALDYRMSQPLMSRVGMSSNVKAISGLGTASKYLGAAGYGAAALGTVMDYQLMKNGQMSGARFGYNTFGTAVSVGVGIGVGVVPGAAAGGTFYLGQQMYDGYNRWIDQMSIYLTNFENGLKWGWVPGR